MKNRPIITGIIAVASPLPLLIFSILWYWVWFFGIGMGLLNYDNVPLWLSFLCSAPLLISPFFSLFGVVHGIVKIKATQAVLGIVLSFIGLLENFIIFYGMYYIGTRF